MRKCVKKGAKKRENARNSLVFSRDCKKVLSISMTEEGKK